MCLRKKHYSNLLIFLISLMCCIGITELAMRMFLQNILGTDERNSLYRYDEKLGWFPIENSHSIFRGSIPINAEHNSRGFRDSEHIVDIRPRIVFLGDSFVWGYDVEKQERFTEKLRAKFANLSIYNLGVSGYGTDQEYLLLQQQYNFYNPNIVFLVISVYSEQYENTHNKVYKGYFKPYFIANGDSLKLQGVPVPKSWPYFLTQHNALSSSYWFRFLTKLYFEYTDPPSLEFEDPMFAIITEMHKFINMRGAKFIVGWHGIHPKLEKYLKDSNIPCIDLTNSYVYPSNSMHWTPDGHTFVSEKIYDFLIREKFLEEVARTRR